VKVFFICVSIPKFEQYEQQDDKRYGEYFGGVAHEVVVVVSGRALAMSNVINCYLFYEGLKMAIFNFNGDFYAAVRIGKVSLIYFQWLCCEMLQGNFGNEVRLVRLEQTDHQEKATTGYFSKSYKFAKP
jgi:hypothetical protein